jgi:hypothetical protein
MFETCVNENARSLSRDAKREGGRKKNRYINWSGNSIKILSFTKAEKKYNAKEESLPGTLVLIFNIYENVT